MERNKVEDLSVIGKGLPRVDGRLKVTGEAKFCDDLNFPGMLYGKILRSPYPHARILNVHVEKVREMPGVRAVITGKDVPNKKYGVWKHVPETLDETALCIDKARFVGDPVAAVAAIDEDLAQEALELIEVDYEILPPVFDPMEAMSTGAPLIHEKKNNIAWEINLSHGDVEKGMREADYVREDEFTVPGQNHTALEAHCSIGNFDLSGKLTLYSSTQSPFAMVQDLAFVLGLKPKDIRVIRPYVGGGFGGKFQILPVDFCTALLSKVSGRPVKIAYTRQEVFQCTRQRHPMRIWLKTAYNKDGTLVAKKCKNVGDNGAYNGAGLVIIGRAGAQLSMLYKVKHFEYQGLLVYTNNPVGGAFRGFGNIQARFADESQMDMIAEHLGLDPVEIRIRNARQAGETTPHGWKVTSCGLTECIQKAREKANWDSKKRQKVKYKGIGIACSSYISGVNIGYDISAAFVKVEIDGTITLITGATDIGQGSDTTLCQIVAEEIGVPFENIRIVTQDTEVTPADCGTIGSRVTFMAGKAAEVAARDAKAQIISAVSDLLEANPEDIEIKSGRVQIKGSPERGMSFEEAINAILYSKDGKIILGRGFYNPPTENLNPKTGSGNISPAYSFGAQIFEVEVHPVTGRVKVTNVTAAHDCGRAINPLSLEGQVEGSVVQGMGYALTEDLHLKEGRIENSSFSSYRIPTTLDIPAIKTILVETIDPEGPFGAKGVSEGTILPAAPAVANAIYDAVGVRIKDLPITPEKILAALSEKKKQ
jgi:4-hydroxybenzoyl-CoA reductase alpha subunit